MIRIAIGLRQAARSIVALLLIAVACQVVQCAPAAEPDATAPKIAEVRVGLDSHYKLGTWTPIVVEVSGAGSAAGLHVEVSALDSDGVTTKASAPVAQASADGRSSAVVYTQVGRVGSPITVALADERANARRANSSAEGESRFLADDRPDSGDRTSGALTRRQTTRYCRGDSESNRRNEPGRTSAD